jgi:hypothetical protein
MGSGTLEPRRDVVHGQAGKVTVVRPAPAVVVLEMAGDVADLGEAVFLEIESDLTIQGPIRLFIQAPGPSANGMAMVPAWWSRVRDAMKSLVTVDVLADPAFARTTGELLRQLTGLGAKMTLHGEEHSFGERLEAATQSPISARD